MSDAVTNELADDMAGPIAIDAYGRIAKLQVLVADRCADEDVPLSEIQVTLLAQVAAQVMDGTQAEFARLLTDVACLQTGRHEAIGL